MEVVVLEVDNSESGEHLGMGSGGGRDAVVHQPCLDSGHLGSVQEGIQAAGDETLVNVQPQHAASILQRLLDDQGSRRQGTKNMFKKKKKNYTT